MGFSHQEFRRALTRTYAGADLTQHADGADVRHGAGVVRIRMGPERIRRIALLALPSIHVTFTFEDLDTAEREDFMARFELYFRRGGG